MVNEIKKIMKIYQQQSRTNGIDDNQVEILFQQVMIAEQERIKQIVENILKHETHYDKECQDCMFGFKKEILKQIEE